MSATQQFHEATNDALERISAQLWPEAKLTLVIYTPGKPKLDIVLKDQDLDLDEVLSTLRRAGLSIDGDNAYKRDQLDAVVGAMCFGKQNNNPPPAEHWGQRFWDIGRAEGQQRDDLIAALTRVTDCLRQALTGGEVSAKAAGEALTKAAEMIELHRA